LKSEMLASQGLGLEELLHYFRAWSLESCRKYDKIKCQKVPAASGRRAAIGGVAPSWGTETATAKGNNQWGGQRSLNDLPNLQFKLAQRLLFAAQQVQRMNMKYEISQQRKDLRKCSLTIPERYLR